MPHVPCCFPTLLVHAECYPCCLPTLHAYAATLVACPRSMPMLLPLLLANAPCLCCYPCACQRSMPILLPLLLAHAPCICCYPCCLPVLARQPSRAADSSPPLLAGGGGWGPPLCIGKQEVGAYIYRLLYTYTGLLGRLLMKFYSR
jgi:hypothetical protein